MSAAHPPDERHSLYKFLSFGIFRFFRPFNCRIQVDAFEFVSDFEIQFLKI